MLNIKNPRKKSKLTQQQLADRVGSSREYINSIENGKKVPSIEMLGKIAQALNTKVKNLIEESV